MTKPRLFINGYGVADVAYDPVDSVSVTADGVKNLTALFTELYSLIDLSKVTAQSYLIFETTLYRVNRVDNNYGFIDFGTYYGGSSSPYVYVDRLRVGGSSFSSLVVFTPTGSSNHSSEVLTSGKEVVFYY